MSLVPMEKAEILEGTASGTTSGAGNLITSISSTGVQVIGAWCTNNPNVALFPFYTTDNYLGFRTMDEASAGYAGVSNTAISVKYWYKTS